MMLIFEVVEHYRNLWLFVRIIHEKDEHGDSICSDKSCPRMSAGPYVVLSCPAKHIYANSWAETIPSRGSMLAASQLRSQHQSTSA